MGKRGKESQDLRGGAGGFEKRSTAGLKLIHPPLQKKNSRLTFRVKVLNNAAFFPPWRSSILSPTIAVSIRNPPHHAAAVTSPPPLSSFPLRTLFPPSLLQQKRASESPPFQRRENKKKRQTAGGGREELGGWWRWWWGGAGRENQRRTDAKQQARGGEALALYCSCCRLRLRERVGERGNKTEEARLENWGSFVAKEEPA